MNRTVRNLAIITLIAAATTNTAFAFPFRGASADNAAPPNDEGDGSDAALRHGGGRGRPIFQMLQQLDLTGDQKTAVAKVLGQMRGELKPLRDHAQEARQKVFTAAAAEPFDETALRQAVRDAAQIQEELTVGRAKAFSQIRAVLTPEQRKQLLEMKDALKNQAQSGRKRGEGMLDAWIAGHGG